MNKFFLSGFQFLSAFYFLSHYSSASLQKYIQVIVDSRVIFDPVNKETRVGVKVWELAFHVDAILSVAEARYADLNTVHKQRRA